MHLLLLLHDSSNGCLKLWVPQKEHPYRTLANVKYLIYLNQTEYNHKYYNSDTGEKYTFGETLNVVSFCKIKWTVYSIYLPCLVFTTMFLDVYLYLQIIGIFNIMIINNLCFLICIIVFLK